MSRQIEAPRRLPAAGLCAAAAVLLLALASPGGASAQTTYTVDNATVTGDGCTGTHTTIQAAINVAAPGDTVVVCPGTYAEPQVLINKSITVASQDSLSGTDDPADETIIDGGNATGLPSAGTVRIETPDTDTGNATLSGFTVRNAGTGGTRAAVFAKPLSPLSTATLSNSKIEGSNDLNGSDYGFYAFFPRGPVVIANSRITNTDFNPVLIEQAAAGSNVHGNTIAPLSAASGSAYFNMTYGGVDATGLHRVANNTFSIRGITFNGAFNNIAGTGTFASVEIANNTVTQLASGSGVALINGDTDSGGAEGVIDGAVISGNTISDTDVVGTRGIRLLGLVTNTSITCNTINDVERSISGESNGGGFPAGTRANFNNFESNAGGLHWLGMSALSAENNWWGSPTGPTHPDNPGGTGDPITDPNDQVSYVPFRTAPGGCAAPALGSIVISEFRLRGPGPNAAQNEFIELYNASGADVIVFDPEVAGGGWALVSSEAPTVPKFVVPNGTIIPARGHFLAANPNGYSLAGYPAGGTCPCSTAVGDIAYFDGIPNGSGLALFRTALPANFTPANRLDAVGFAVSGVGFSEGTPLSPAGGITDNSQHSFVRRLNSGVPRDTQDNESDFVFIATDAALHDGRQSELGAPGPENLSSPIQLNDRIKASLLDAGVSSFAVPNFERDSSVVPNGQHGTLFIRRRFTNQTGHPVTRLRFRIVDITTLNSPGYAPGNSQSDLRVLSSNDDTVGTTGGPVAVRGLTREQPPAQGALDGGLNTSLSDDTVTLMTPLAPGATVNVAFRMGVEQRGGFRFFVNVEALTDAPSPAVTSKASPSSRVAKPGLNKTGNGRR